jgi:hypothetical protein
MNFSVTKISGISAALALSSLVVSPLVVQGATINYNFNVTIDFGLLIGQNFPGSLSYDDATPPVFVDPSGFSVLPIQDFAFSFQGDSFTEADDPTATVDLLTSNLSFLGLNYSATGFSLTSGAFTLDLADSSFAYDLGGGVTGTGVISYNLQPSPNVPESSTVLGLGFLGLGLIIPRILGHLK